MTSIFSTLNQQIKSLTNTLPFKAVFLRWASFTFVLVFSISCKPNFHEGKFCAEVTYYYSKTGTQSKYNLIVETEENKLVKIYWSNGGWLDETHFNPPYIVDGETSFESDKGVKYTVKLLDEESECNSKGNGLSEKDFIKNEFNKLCSKCGNIKSESEKYCEQCLIKMEKVFVYATVDFKFYDAEYFNKSFYPRLTQQGKTCTPIFEISKQELAHFKQKFYSSVDVQHYNHSSSYTGIGYLTYPETIEVKTFRTMEEANDYQIKNCNKTLSTYYYYSKE